MLFDLIHIENQMYNMLFELISHGFRCSRHSKLGVKDAVGCNITPQSVITYTTQSVIYSPLIDVFQKPSQSLFMWSCSKRNRLHIFYIKQGKERTKRRTALYSVGSVELHS